MDNNRILCRNCGKELPAESSFCPYCMTKFTEEIPAKNSKFPKNKSAAKIVIIVLAVIFVLAIMEDVGTKDTENKETLTVTAFSPPADSSDEPIFSVSNTDNSPGVSCIKPSYTTVKLTDTEKLLLDYFDTDAFSVEYNVLKENPDIYKNSQVYFHGVLNKIILQDNDKVTALVEYGAYIGFDQVYYKSGNMALVKLDKNNASDITGKTFTFYATFKGIENHDESFLPSFEVNKITDYAENSVYSAKYSANEITKISQFFFGNKATLRQSQNEDFKFLKNNSYEDISSEYFVADIKGLEDKGFIKYGLATTEGGHVIDCETDETLSRYMTFSGDFKNIYVHTYDWTADTFTFDCYDKSFTKLWSRQFSESALAFMDFTADCIYLNIGDKLYILDSKNGNDLVEPKTTGSHHAVRKLEDGILLVASDDTNSTITKTDLDGNVLWSKDINIASYSSRIQITDGKYIVQLSSYNSSSAYYGETVATFVLKPDGTVEFSHRES